MTSMSFFITRQFSSSSSPSPSTTSLSSISRIIFKQSNLKTLVETFKQHSKDPQFRQKSALYDRTVERLASAKQFHWIEEILEDQKNYKDITKEGFTIRLISLYGKSGMFDHALKMFDEMPQLNCSRTVKSFNALLGACVACRRFDLVYDFFRDLPSEIGVKPDVVSYNVVIKGFCEMGLLDSAVRMVDEMERDGRPPNLITFNTLFDGLYRKRRFEDGERVWGMMGKYNLVPDVISYNMKLHGFVSDGKMVGAMKLVEEMKVKELKLDVFTFNTLFKGLCYGDIDGSSLEDVKRWYKEMMKVKCEPNRLTFATLLRFACDKGDFMFGARLCRGLFYRRCHLNEGKLIQRVVDGLVKQGNTKEAELLVRLGKESKFSCYHGLEVPKLD